MVLLLIEKGYPLDEVVFMIRGWSFKQLKKFCNKKYGNYGNVFDMEKVFEQSKQDA